MHCIADAFARPIAFHIMPGEATDITAREIPIDLPEKSPAALLADKAHDADRIRFDLERRGVKPVIPPRSNRKTSIPYDVGLYRLRNAIERVFV